MTFDVGAAEYRRFMGRYSEPLAREFVGRLGLRPGQRVLDVGSGPGALTTALVSVLGPSAVEAIDPSRSFVDALRVEQPGVTVTVGNAEDLPYPDRSFDLALAQLVVHFMADPVRGLTEMRRVTRSGGVVAASVWDHAGGRGPLSLFWRAAQDLQPAVRGEADLAGVREGQLAELSRAAGLTAIESNTLTITVGFQTFDEWWGPFTLGVGPAGAYVHELDDGARRALRDRCAELVPTAPFAMDVSAWWVRGTA
jgi:SAM-dependent methyltransferase